MQLLVAFDGVDASAAPVIINGITGIEAGDRLDNVVNATSGTGVNFAPVVPNTQMIVQLSGNLSGQRIIALIERDE